MPWCALKRKLKIVCIAPELLIEFLKHPVPPGISTVGIPEDARIMGANWSEPFISIDLTLYSESFEELAKGQPIPLLEVKFARDYSPALVASIS